jgi:hypothetical protein
MSRVRLLIGTRRVPHPYALLRTGGMLMPNHSHNHPCFAVRAEPLSAQDSVQ